VIRVGSWFWTVVRQPEGYSNLDHRRLSQATNATSQPTHHHIPTYAHGAHLHALTSTQEQSGSASSSSTSTGVSQPNPPPHLHGHPKTLVPHPSSGHTHNAMAPPHSTSMASCNPNATRGVVVGPRQSSSGSRLELEPWPMRRVVYHAAEWLEWLGCEEAVLASLGTTREAEAEGVGVGVFR
jgi:hypothetical protein